jgi:hypothetical protein
MPLSGKMKSFPVWAGVAVAGFAILAGMEPFLLGLLDELTKGNGDPRLLQLYPSLPSKLASLGPERIQEFALQIKYRWLILILFAFFIQSGPTEKPGFEPEEKNLIWRIRLFFGIQLVYLPDLLNELTIRFAWRAFYTPLPIFSSLFPDFPPIWIIQFIVIFVFGIAAFFILSKWKPGDFLPALLALSGLILWTFLLAVFFGFGKIDHTYASLFSAYIFLVAWLFYWHSDPGKGFFGFRIFQAGIWGCYFFSGLEKVFLSGFDWAGDAHFQSLCWQHPTALCSTISEISQLPEILMVMVLWFQLATILQWRFPDWGYVTFSGGILFHLSTWLILSVGGWQSPWILMLFMLLPLGKKRLKVIGENG